MLTSDINFQRWGDVIDTKNVEAYPFKLNPVVHACIKKLLTITLLPFYIIDYDNTETETSKERSVILNFNSQYRTLRPTNTKINIDSPWYKLFQSPTGNQTTSDFWQLVLMYCLLSPGDCFFFNLNANNEPVKSRTERPAKIIPIPGNLVKAVTKPSTSNTGLVEFDGWSYGSQTYKDYQLQLFRLLPNPYDPLRGIDPITAAKEYLSVDNNSTAYASNFFKSGGLLSGVIYSDTKIDPQTADQLESKWASRYGGGSNAGKTPVLSNGLKYQPIQSTNRESDLVGVKGLTKEAICWAFGLAVGDLEENEALSSKLWHSTLIPIIKKIEEFIEWRYLGYTNEFAMFDLSNVEALRNDLLEKLKASRQFWEMGYPINRINDRLQLGMGNQEFGDLAFAAPGFIPISYQIKQIEAGINVKTQPNNPVSSNNKTTGTNTKNDINDGKLSLLTLVYKLRKKLLANKNPAILESRFRDIGYHSLYLEIIKDAPKDIIELRRYFNAINKFIKDN